MFPLAAVSAICSTVHEAAFVLAHMPRNPETPWTPLKELLNVPCHILAHICARLDKIDPNSFFRRHLLLVLSAVAIWSVAIVSLVTRHPKLGPILCKLWVIMVTPGKASPICLVVLGLVVLHDVAARWLVMYRYIVAALQAVLGCIFVVAGLTNPHLHLVRLRKALPALEIKFSMIFIGVQLRAATDIELKIQQEGGQSNLAYVVRCLRLLASLAVLLIVHGLGGCLGKPLLRNLVVLIGLIVKTSAHYLVVLPLRATASLAGRAWPFVRRAVEALLRVVAETGLHVYRFLQRWATKAYAVMLKVVRIIQPHVVYAVQKVWCGAAWVAMRVQAMVQVCAASAWRVYAVMCSHLETCRRFLWARVRWVAGIVLEITVQVWSWITCVGKFIWDRLCQVASFIRRNAVQIWSCITCVGKCIWNRLCQVASFIRQSAVQIWAWITCVGKFIWKRFCQVAQFCYQQIALVAAVVYRAALRLSHLVQRAAIQAINLFGLECSMSAASYKV